MSTSRWTAAALAAPVALGLAACQNSEPEAQAVEQLHKIDVGVLLTVDLAPFMYALEEGIFEKNGLAVEYQVSSGGGELVPAMMAGDYDFSFLSYVQVLQAAHTGLDIIVASGSHSSTPGADVPSGVWTTPETGIETMADLQGATISVNALGSIAELLIVAALADEGLDRNDYSLLEVPFSEVPAALDQGRIDAGWVAEPARTSIISELDGVFVGSGEDPDRMSASERLQDIPIAGYAARGSEDPQVLAAFNRSMAEAIEVIAGDPDIARSLAQTYTEIPAEVLGEISLSKFELLAPADLRKLHDLMYDYGLLPEPIENVEELVYMAP